MPLWSWMAYKGRITFIEQVEWNINVYIPFSSKERDRVVLNGQLGIRTLSIKCGSKASIYI